jgi:NTP pyrophosphatase (non-canonical NTP hydrolase)
MTLNEYQQRAMTTCLPESENFAYMMLNLAGEVGEIAGNVNKYIRKGYANIDGNRLHLYSQGDDNAACEREEDLRKEAGDVLWQLSGLCTVMGWDLEDIARQNLDKLADRKQRGVIASQGDNR